MIYALKNKKPKINGTNHFIADNAVVAGDVTIGNDVSIWFGAVIRGDEDSVVIGDATNIQDCCVVHVDHNRPVIIGNKVTIGHKAIIHGCTIGDQSLIGMNAVILDGAVIGKNCIIGANSLITQGKQIPDNSLVVGSPGKIIRQLSEEEVNAMMVRSAKIYVDLIAEYKNLEPIIF